MNIIDNFHSEGKGKIEKILSEDGVELIDAKLVFCSGDYRLCCLVDYANGGITVEKCAMLNKRIVKFLEESNILGADFIVEVDSPGLGRSLKTYKDFARMIGKIVGVWPKAPLDGKMYFEGKISDVSEQVLTLEAKGKNYIIDFEKINLGKEKLEG
ncbi:MAG: hypothetical protein WCY05_06225 [Candidatus Omnitrophota bacterium]